MAQVQQRSVAGPVVLIIRDGWGENPNPEHASFNAVEVARARGLLPVDDLLRREYPGTLIKTSGEDVGLPEGTMGNSEVGHQNIGAGRIVDQESVAITKACRAGLEHNAIIAALMTKLKSTPSAKLHLMGIASDAGVHGLLNHLYALVRAARVQGLSQGQVCLHLFTDGRDTGPFTGKGFIEAVERELASIGLGRIVTLCGRFYAMDRDHRWERVKLAYDAMTGRGSAAPGVTPRYENALLAIQDYYDKPTADGQRGDEFVTPRVIGRDQADADGTRIRDGDAVLFYNYRGDRPRELSAAFVFPDDRWSAVKPSPDSGRNGFDRGPKLSIGYTIMTEYWEELLPFVRVAFPKPPKMTNIAGEYISNLGLTQFRCAETEKYPHVTFFFNDYRDPPFPGETRENPPSPRGIATYDLKPEMSAREVCDAVLRRLAKPRDGGASDRCEDVIIVNFANGDMVGHTGVLEAAVRACSTVDGCVGEILAATLRVGGQLIITADHGNCEQMWDPVTKAPHTAHTVYDVPLHVVGAAYRGLAGDHAGPRGGRVLRGDFQAKGWFDDAVRAGRGKLADVMPTALAMLGIDKPQEMEGESLLGR